jgi:endonuclease/exonuclease/phosphatase family metal-dependent hydrolase
MEHSSSVLALAGALLLAGGGDSRLTSVTNGAGFAERSPAAAWSRSLRITEQASGKGGAPSVAGGATGAGAVPTHLAALAASGRFSLLTYNVAGLPELVSQSDPEVNIGLISPLLNHYDVALVQEDFSYHTRLTEKARHGYRSETMHQSLALMPDGLNWFSQFAFGWVHRVRWGQCNGYLGAASDCLADKGFSFAELTLAPGVTVDVYNLHAEAGSAPLDMAVRRQNFEQLADYIRSRSGQHALIVAGDTNLRLSSHEDGETLDHFLDSTGASDACRRFGCGEERIDRVMFRGSREIEIAVLGWWTDRRFVDIDGAPLSDHPAIGVELSWRRSSAPDLVAGR